MTRARLAAPAFLALAAVALAACGGGGSASPAAPGTSPSPPAMSPGGSPSGVPDPSAAPSGSPTGESTEVVGVEYAFENVPETTAAGTTFTFRNDGDEVHEMLIIRRNDDVPQSWEELLALPADEAQNLASVVGNAFALPGEEAAGAVTVSEPGDYAMVCFIPTGTTELPTDASATLPPGAPHFTQGMVEEFTVTE